MAKHPRREEFERKYGRILKGVRLKAQFFNALIGIAVGFLVTITAPLAICSVFDYDFVELIRELYSNPELIFPVWLIIILTGVIFAVGIRIWTHPEERELWAKFTANELPDLPFFL